MVSCAAAMCAVAPRAEGHHGDSRDEWPPHNSVPFCQCGSADVNETVHAVPTRIGNGPHVKCVHDATLAFSRRTAEDRAPIETWMSMAKRGYASRHVDGVYRTLNDALRAKAEALEEGQSLPAEMRRTRQGHRSPRGAPRRQSTEAAQRSDPAATQRGAGSVRSAAAQTRGAGLRDDMVHRAGLAITVRTSAAGVAIALGIDAQRASGVPVRMVA